jgi:YfiH family protein
MAEFLTTPTLGLPHGYFTRRGGVSSGAYSSLNCSLSGGDARPLVMENRALAARALGCAPTDLLGLTQVHGSDVVTVAAPWQPGEGPRADAMVTARRGLGLGIITADCAPVLFADQQAGVIGAAHAGWRSAVGGVLEATLMAMRALGARQITACVGPCIAQSSYEVGPDMREAALAAGHNADRFFSNGQRADRWQFDLSGYCQHRLQQAGAAADGVGIDTLADEARFFSHRRRTLRGEAAIGHQLSAIMLPAG